MSKPFIADFKPVETLSNFSGSSKYVTDSTIAFARLAGSSDLKIPEIYAGSIKKGLSINAKFSAYKNKNYKGKIDSVASRIDAQTRSLLVRAKIENENFEIIPGSLLEIEILYQEKNALGIPDTSIMYEGTKKFIYKVIENNIIKKVEIETGVRNKGNIEILSGLNEDDKIIAEGLTKVRPGMKVKPIIKSQ